MTTSGRVRRYFTVAADGRPRLVRHSIGRSRRPVSRGAARGLRRRRPLSRSVRRCTGEASARPGVVLVGVAAAAAAEPGTDRQRAQALRRREQPKNPPTLERDRDASEHGEEPAKASQKLTQPEDGHAMPHNPTRATLDAAGMR